MRCLAAHFPAVVITGARQTGQTTLLTRLFPEYRYISPALPALAQLAEEDPPSFLPRHPRRMTVTEWVSVLQASNQISVPEPHFIQMLAVSGFRMSDMFEPATDSAPKPDGARHMISARMHLEPAPPPDGTRVQSGKSGLGVT